MNVSFLTDPEDDIYTDIFRDIVANIIEISKTAELDDFEQAFIERRSCPAVQPAEPVGQIADPKAWLQDLADRITALPETERAAAFAAAAKAHSMGARRDDGGDLGWLEVGDQPTYDPLWRGLAGHTCSAPTKVGAVWALIYMLEREEDRVRSFDEVAAELKRSRKNRIFRQERERFVGVLRERANIRALDPPEKPQ